MMIRLHKTWSVQGAAALFSIGTMLVLTGCQSDVQTSADYQKLPPGEGEKRMTDTLKRRASVRPGHTPPPPGYTAGSPPAGP